MWGSFVGLIVTRIIFPDGRRRGSLATAGEAKRQVEYIPIDK
jgi:hypothetical protein